VLGVIARRLGVDERDATPLPDLLAVSLRGRRLLVLLDNFEHLLAARDAVLALLRACPELVLLVTSRVALDVRGGRDYPVAPLVLPGAPGAPEALRNSPAVELLVERARAVGAELPLDAETAPALAEICRRLDGLPLAIELAAAGGGCFPRRRCWPGWTAGCRCWPAARTTCQPGSRPCGTRSPGAMSCWTSRNRRCSGGCACSWAAARWKRRR
jgi:hypothetical protein